MQDSELVNGVLGHHCGQIPQVHPAIALVVRKHCEKQLVIKLAAHLVLQHELSM